MRKVIQRIFFPTLREMSKKVAGAVIMKGLIDGLTNEESEESKESHEITGEDIVKDSQVIASNIRKLEEIDY